jgi:hypothetical protein
MGRREGGGGGRREGRGGRGKGSYFVTDGLTRKRDANSLAMRNQFMKGGCCEEGLQRGRKGGREGGREGGRDERCGGGVGWAGREEKHQGGREGGGEGT